jgi:hypothetical protein
MFHIAPMPRICWLLLGLLPGAGVRAQCTVAAPPDAVLLVADTALYGVFGTTYRICPGVAVSATQCFDGVFLAGVGSTFTLAGSQGNTVVSQGQVVLAGSAQGTTVYVAAADSLTDLGSYTPTVIFCPGGPHIDLGTPTCAGTLAVPAWAPSAGITVVPNPVQHSLAVQGAQGPIRALHLCDALGRPVATAAGTNVLQVAALASGSYTLQVHTAAGMATRRVVKE